MIAVEAKKRMEKAAKANAMTGGLANLKKQKGKDVQPLPQTQGKGSPAKSNKCNTKSNKAGWTHIKAPELVGAGTQYAEVVMAAAQKSRAQHSAQKTSTKKPTTKQWTRSNGPARQSRNCRR